MLVGYNITYESITENDETDTICGAHYTVATALL